MNTTAPSVTLKLATTLDSRIATAAGESRWITGLAARTETHRMRAAHDAVMVGGGTLRADDPELSARLDPPPARQPLRVVIDRRLSHAVDSRVARTAGLGPVLVLAGSEADQTAAETLKRAGVDVEILPDGPDGVDLDAALSALGARGVRRLLVEGGGVLAASLIKMNAVNRLEWFRAPILLGGDGRAAMATLALDNLAAAPRFRLKAVRTLGEDLWESYERA